MVAGVVTLGFFSVHAAIRAVTPTPWNGDPNCWQMNRHNEKLKQIANGGTPVVFIGDSITHFWETHGKAVWEKFFAQGPRRAINLGTSADRTEHVLWRLTEGKELDGYEAKCILLMIGTNNSGHFPFEKEPPVDTILGIREILNVIAEKQPKARVILTSIFPRGAKADNAYRRRNDVVNMEIAKFADGKKVIWCDFSDKFLTADGRLSPEIFPDLLHPGERGYEIWAGSVVPLIDKVLAASPDETIASVWPSNPQAYSFVSPAAARPETCFPNQKWWKTRCLEKRNEIVDNGVEQYDIVMVGDSITHRWEREGGEGRELFAKLKETYRTLNLGYGGDKTQNVIWRMMNGELEGYKTKLFTLMIGTNNKDRNPADVAAGIKSILNIIRSKHAEAKVVLMPIFPRGASPDDKNRMRNEAVNAIIKGYADGKDVIWLDFNSRFLEPDGKMTKRVMDDLLHPNAVGYQIWADAIVPVFRQILGK
jgi:lysophospholipase L1-like esterase